MSTIMSADHYQVSFIVHVSHGAGQHAVSPLLCAASYRTVSHGVLQRCLVPLAVAAPRGIVSHRIALRRMSTDKQENDA